MLHSRYNPQGEAERFVNSLPLAEDLRFLILIEPGLGYMIPPLRKRLPGAKIAALHAAPRETAGEFPGGTGKADAVWYPGEERDLRRFLEDSVPEIPASLIKIVEWRPALALYGEAYLKVVSETAEFVKRLDAGLRTARAFGRRWFRNFFRNLMIARKALYVPPGRAELKDLVITGAGPGLESAIPLIREMKARKPLLVLAVSSSVMALEAGGIEPDLVITSDGGGWALFHIFESLRPLAGRSPGLSQHRYFALTMTAALPSQCGDFPLLFISDGSRWQNLVLKELGIPFLNLPQRGTVSAAAVDLAFFLTRGNIFVAGLDLAQDDIIGHARPYSFERLLEEKSLRLKPVYSQAFVRSREIKAGDSHKIYASWFKGQLETWPRRIYPLGKNNPLFEGGPLEARTTSATPEPFLKVFPLKNHGNLAGRGAAFLEKALENGEHGPAVWKELAPLLSLPESWDPAAIGEVLDPIEKYRP
jgi:hypothetical protein